MLTWNSLAGTNMKPGKTRVLVHTQDGRLATHYTTCLGTRYDVSVHQSGSVIDHLPADNSSTVLIYDPVLADGNLSDRIAALLEHGNNLRVILVEDGESRTFDQYAMFKLGVHGFCRHDIPENLLTKAVQVILEGEYWIPRKLITRVISEIASDTDEVVSSPDGPEDSLISTLTPRELQVARMVHMGGNNKMIARELDISERTVKAHLSAIFRKLDIENRLHLALYFSSHT